VIVPTLLLGVVVAASEAVLEATPVAEVTLAVEAAVVKNATSAGKSATSLGTALKAEAATEAATTKAVATVAGMEQEEEEQAVEARPATLVEAMDICLVS